MSLNKKFKKRKSVLLSLGIPPDKVKAVFEHLENKLSEEEIIRYFGPISSHYETPVETKHRGTEKDSADVIPYHSLGYSYSLPITKKSIKQAIKNLPRIIRREIDLSDFNGYYDNQSRQYILAERNEANWFIVRLPIHAYGPEKEKDEEGILFPEEGEKIILFGRDQRHLAVILNGPVQRKKKTALFEIKLEKSKPLRKRDLELLDSLHHHHHHHQKSK